MAFSQDLKTRLLVALAEPAAATELEAAIVALQAKVATNVAALAGTLTGTVTGTMANVADIALSTSNTYTDAAVNTAVNTAILAMNLQLKELQTKVNAEIAALKVAGLQASS